METANIKDKLCLTKMTFYNRATVLVDKGRVADITYLDLCKTLTQSFMSLNWRYIDLMDR